MTPAAWAGVYKPLWLAAALLNSGYSYFWDLERDWEIQAFTGPPSGALYQKQLCRVVLRPTHHTREHTIQKYILLCHCGHIADAASLGRQLRKFRHQCDGLMQVARGSSALIQVPGSAWQQDPVMCMLRSAFAVWQASAAAG